MHNDTLETNNLRIFFLRPQKLLAAERAAQAGALLKGGIRQATLISRDACLLANGGYVLLDFGRELHGGVDLTLGRVTGGTNASLRITFGESAMEALSHLGEKNATNDHSPRDFSVPAQAMSHFKTGSTGFRFVKLEAAGAELELAGVQAFLEMRDLKPAGRFSCSDSRLNQIWETGAYTVQLNMQEYLWDGIKRDWLVWVGDMHPEVSTVRSVFGYDACVPKSLDLIRDETPQDAWMNGIPSYSMWWIIIHHDWYLQNGDLTYLRSQKDYLKALLRRLAGAIAPDGTYRFENAWDFVDWSSSQTQYAAAGIHGVLSMALETGAALCSFLDEQEMAGTCLMARERLRHNRLPYAGNKQMAALVSLAGLADPETVEKEVLSQNPCAGLSAFLGYYVLHARAKAGNMPGALEVIRKYWGGMLDMGATTFWEEFDLEWTKNAAPIDQLVPPGKDDIHGDFGRGCFTRFRRSLCHGWASGPTPFLSQRVLGVRPLLPGCRRVLIQPDLGDLDWAKGSYPTPYGPVSVEHRMENGIHRTQYEAPEEIEIVRA